MVHPLMARAQYVDYQPDPGNARERVLQAVRLLDDQSGTWREGDNPFPGLESFTAALGRVFFGRTVETREVGNRLRSMASSGGILIVVGSSGSGKSSLINAGVIPLLERDPTWLVVSSLMPGVDPVAELARVLAATSRRVGLAWSAGEVRGRLEGGTDGLRRIADDLLATDPGMHHRRLLITVDQAEELFTRTPPSARQRFAELLRDDHTALRPRFANTLHGPSVGHFTLGVAAVAGFPIRNARRRKPARHDLCHPA